MSFLEFKPITIDDRERIQKFTLRSMSQICDLSFSNLYGWSKRYNTHWAVFENSLIIRFTSKSLSYPAYLMPICESSTRFVAVVEALEQIAEQGQYPLTFMGVTPHCREFIERNCPKGVHFQSDEGSKDYIYLREKLVNLSGKSLQSKRNHINKFEKLYPNWSYEEITDDNIDECIALETKWLQGEESPDSSRLDEQSMIDSCLRQRQVLGLLTGAIRVEGRIIAFSFGSPINENTFGVHVEKADINYEGAFTIINREFAKRIPEKYIYINREEDLGLEGLRKSKQSYKPVLMLSKDVAILT